MRKIERFGVKLTMKHTMINVVIFWMTLRCRKTQTIKIKKFTIKVVKRKTKVEVGNIL